MGVIKYRDKTYGSSGSGTEVIANPDTEATEELEKISVSGTTYSIPSGGGGGVELTKIWSGTGDYGSDIELPSDFSPTYNGIMLFVFNATSSIATQIGSIVFSGNTFTIGYTGQSSGWAQLQYISGTHKLHFVNSTGYGGGTISEIYIIS